MNKKRVAILLCVLTLTMAALPFFVAYANRNPVVTLDGYLIAFPDQNPIMDNNRVLVPVRGVFEKMGFYVTWNAETRVARLESDTLIITIPADSNSFTISNNGFGHNAIQIITPDVPQRMVNNRMLLPLRAVAEAVGATAYWDSNNRAAQIISPPQPSPPPPAIQNIRSWLGEGRDLISFDSHRHLFGTQTGHSYFGPHNIIYSFENGLSVESALSVRAISNISINFNESENKIAFNFSGIDGTSNVDDVIYLFGNHDPYMVLNNTIGETMMGATTSRTYRVGDYRNVAFYSDAYNNIVGIRFYMRHDALLI
ncbi:MAG: copper amine oxidase N-terminal domain-containing protein [Defluviitaleaceae bacterium]|nr:copper amine oxidase N-terminal domain-containing protein [Defluviitaleaceae bacterium]